MENTRADHSRRKKLCGDEGARYFGDSVPVMNRGDREFDSRLLRKEQQLRQDQHASRPFPPDEMQRRELQCYQTPGWRGEELLRL